MDQKYFAEMLDTLATRAGHGTVSWLGFSNKALRRHLLEVFDRAYGDTGSFLADPAFEAVFGWQTATKTMSELSGNLLNPLLVKAMDQPDPTLGKEYRFNAERLPYAHQLRSWELLTSKVKQSVVVTSGTGSGKTECFLVPILNALINEHAAIGRPLVGVRALFLYPLNALINSQRERLRAWTYQINEAARFCLYNGMTPEMLPTGEARQGSEIRDRQTLRREPPPILVTNATMLEYMLVRTQDLPILQLSQGRLEWIILDEAHTYVGSQAAELALLIRRVLHAFGAKSEDVRFVATSATIGDANGVAGEQLRRFLSRVSGSDIDRVQVVSGTRSIPELSQSTSKDNQISLEELTSIDLDVEPKPKRYDALVAHPLARKIRQLFTNQNAASVARLSDITPLIAGNTKISRDSQQCALGWLDMLTSAENADGIPFLPLRSHLFHQTLAGLWCCSDPRCSLKQGTRLQDPEWPFGSLFLEPRKYCSCGAPVYQLVACDDCGTIYLHAEVAGNRVVQPDLESEFDEFALDPTETDADESDPQEFELGGDDRSLLLITNRELPNCGEMHFAKNTGTIIDTITEDAVSVIVYEKGPEGFCCPQCTGTGKRFEEQFRTARVGAPFYLAGVLPTLLEFAPDGEQPLDTTYRGRRLLTFTDSRQGTARLAARLQQDAERTKTRGLIYHNILAHLGNASEAEDQIRALEQMANPPTSIVNLLAEKRLELQNLSAAPFRKLQLAMQQGGTEFDAMRSSYSGFSRALFGGPDGRANLAEMLLLREMGRRPKRQNNLESMGMVAVTYPKLSKIANPPTVWRDKGLSAQQWRDFLKLALDFFVRGGGSLEMREDLRCWMGLPQRQTRIVSSSTDQVSRSQRRWPSVRRSGEKSILIRVLAAVFQIDIKTPEGQDMVDAVLDAAWMDLHGILRPTADGYVLPLEEMAFRLIKNAWVCPFTRRLLDNCLCGISPYLPRNSANAVHLCQSVQIPIYDAPFGNNAQGEDPVRRGRIWLESQEDVRALREEGLWSIFHDRVIEFAMYYSAAEHSAQQPSARLQAYEKKFKEGKINILSCSTTMEMGIDIGGVQQVAMNNVPPHPANYLQRAGRAGRRREMRSTALTLCKANPHDQNVFLNTRWAFDTVLPAPVVSLNSAIIVQRHINALVLAQFLKELLVQKKQEMHKLTCGWFFVGAPDGSPASNFAAWSRTYLDGSNIRFEEGLQQLVRHTALEGLRGSQLLGHCSGHIQEVTEAWMSEWSALLEQEASLGADLPDPAMKAITFQKNRLANEYLLRELSTDGFLPAYGFPTFVASFDNLTITGLRNSSGGDTAGRDDNHFLRRELASRDLVTALREYAPGAEIVIDGLVYRSAGITLNWHIPASEADARETQAIKFAWRCSKCGASGTSVVMTKNCDACGSDLSHFEKYLEPSGFSVDFYQDPHNNVTQPSFVPVERPWVSARGDWSALPNPNLGRYRTTTEGKVYHRSTGVNGSGYAICLVCGRAEPLTVKGDLPELFTSGQGHAKLRAKALDRLCPGSSNRWAISKTVLGHELRTDMLELQLRLIDGQLLNEHPSALTIAVALRDALAGLLGVQSSELGCEARETRNTEGERCQSIFLFDRFAAGYASGAERLLCDMFRKAAEILKCPKACESSCPNCVLDFDQRFEASVLDRKRALAILSEKWLDLLKLPSDLQYFGTSSQVESANIMQAIARESGEPGSKTIRLFASGDPSQWDFPGSTLRHLAYSLLSMSRSVEVIIPRELVKKLSQDDLYSLAAFSEHPNGTARTAEKMPISKKAYLLAEVERSNSVVAWASPDPNALLGSESWGNSSKPIIRGDGGHPSVSEALQPSALRPAPVDHSDKEISIQHQLDGCIQTFGERFWRFMRQQHPATDLLLGSAAAKVILMRYTDRYLFTPVSLAIFRQLVEGLREVVGRDRFDIPEIIVTTTAIRRDSRRSLGGRIYDDWPTSQMRDAVATILLGSLGNGKIKSDEKVVQHSRCLEVVFSVGGSMTLRLDQGVSYWRVASWAAVGSKSPWFDFTNPNATTQAKAIQALDLWIEGQSLPTQIFTKVRKL